MSTQAEIFEKYGRTFSAGQRIFSEGEIGAEMFIIQSGKVRISKQSKDVEKTLVVLEEGDFFGEMAVIDKGPRSANATAEGETRCIVLDEELFEQQMQNNSRIVKKILKNMSTRLRDANNQIENLLIKDANSRVAHTLLQLAHKRGGGKTADIRLDGMNVDELARAVGMESAKAAEILAKMEQVHITRFDQGQVVVVSLDNLEKFIRYLEMKEQFGL
ncbi:MAG TPA: Crp/Fnr family transcriptional regulator [bacterium]|jgi:CRP/FNR family cyclic AMP-dependent transcriptional regulator|nr:Crp/Fnr family transcriptional regulator [bacterium]